MMCLGDDVHTTKSYPLMTKRFLSSPQCEKTLSSEYDKREHNTFFSRHKTLCNTHARPEREKKARERRLSRLFSLSLSFSLSAL